MRTIKATRYICDFCRKSYGKKDAITRHEVSCFKNPDRVCGLCFLKSNVTTDALAVYLENKLNAKDEQILTFLRSITDNCPACMLAALAPLKIYLNFDYAKEKNRFLKEAVLKEAA